MDKNRPKTPIFNVFERKHFFELFSKNLTYWNERKRENVSFSPFLRKPSRIFGRLLEGACALPYSSSRHLITQAPHNKICYRKERNDCNFSNYNSKSNILRVDV